MRKLIINLLSVVLLGCNHNTQVSDCGIVLGKSFEGNGILIVESLSAQDGKIPVVFFPVCQLDPTHIISSALEAHRGIMFYTKYNLVLSALRKNSMIVLKPDTTKPLLIRTVYLAPVHLSFTDTMAIYEKDHFHVFNYILDTKQIKLQQEVTSTGKVYLHKLIAL